MPSLFLYLCVVNALQQLLLGHCARYFINKLSFHLGVKRKEVEKPSEPQTSHPTPEVNSAKKPRLVFTDIQRRTLMAIFKETKRPSKDMQLTIADQLGLKASTVANFFMNARRRSTDKYREDNVPASTGAVSMSSEIPADLTTLSSVSASIAFAPVNLSQTAHVQVSET